MPEEFIFKINRSQYYRILQAIETAACAIESTRCRAGIKEGDEPYYSIKTRQVSELLDLKNQLEQLTGVSFGSVPSLV